MEFWEVVGKIIALLIGVPFVLWMLYAFLSPVFSWIGDLLHVSDKKAEKEKQLRKAIKNEIYEPVIAEANKESERIIAEANKESDIILFNANKKLTDSSNIILEANKKLKDSRETIQKANEYLERQIKKADAIYKKADMLHEYYEKSIRDFDKIIEKRGQAYPWLAPIMADIIALYYEQSAHYLEKKKRPAHGEAARIRELKKITRDIVAEKKLLEYKMKLIEQTFPNIEDFFDSGYDENFELETEETTDAVRKWLSKEEYKELSESERNQLALDRYLNGGNKTRWQLGRDYEMYIGFLYEEKGYKVDYIGIIKGLEDMGRDLLVTDYRGITIIQCKNWSKEKTIHEKHIFQLFGTVTLWNIQHPNNPANGIFVTTTDLSPVAQSVAEELNIEIKKIELGDYPRIKCNINQSTGEKIYHLPFDQQYDRAMIVKSKGECYAYTVSEAEALGFRHAMRHTFDS